MARAFTCSAILQPMHRPTSINTAKNTDCFAFKQISNVLLLSLHGHFRCSHLSPFWGEPSPHLSSFGMPGVKAPFLGSGVVAKERQENSISFVISTTTVTEWHPNKPQARSHRVLSGSPPTLLPGQQCHGPTKAPWGQHFTHRLSLFICSPSWPWLSFSEVFT